MIETDISDRIVAHGDPGEEAYYFWGAEPYSFRLQKPLFDHILQRNAIVRDVAASTRTVLVDLYAALDSSHERDFRRYFFDVAHPRPSTYSIIASLVAEGVRAAITSAAAPGISA